jgi:hypothetical protein
MSVGPSTTRSSWTGIATSPPIAALAPKATWTVPRTFSSSSRLPVSVARSFVPTPSSARLRPEVAVRGQVREQALTELAVGVREVAALDLHLDRLVAAPEAADRRDHEAPLAEARRDEALAARQVAERALAGQVAVVGDPEPAAQVEAEVAAVRARQLGLGRRRQQRRDLAAALPHDVEVDRHQAGEEVLGDAGQRRPRARRRRSPPCAPSCATGTAGTAR